MTDEVIDARRKCIECDAPMNECCENKQCFWFVCPDCGAKFDMRTRRGLATRDGVLTQVVF